MTNTKTTIITENWDDQNNGELTESAIRALYQPGDQFRVSIRTFPAGSKFPGAARSRRCFVLSGACRFEFAHSEVALGAGQFADLPEGRFDFEVTSAEDLVSVTVWQVAFDLQ